MKKLFAVLFFGMSAFAQAPTVTCPTHHVPAQVTGRTKTDGSGRTIAWEYCHGTAPSQHCFWGHD
jgi:hypothetical protein